LVLTEAKHLQIHFRSVCIKLVPSEQFQQKHLKFGRVLRYRSVFTAETGSPGQGEADRGTFSWCTRLGNSWQEVLYRGMQGQNLNFIFHIYQHRILA